MPCRKRFFLKSFFAFFLVLTLVFALFSCAVPVRDYGVNLLGGWTTAGIDPERYEEYFFEEDGTGRKTYVANGLTMSFDFTYKLDGKGLILTSEDGSVVEYAVYFTKKALKLTTSKVTIKLERIESGEL